MSKIKKNKGNIYSGDGPMGQYLNPITPTSIRSPKAPVFNINQYYTQPTGPRTLEEI